LLRFLERLVAGTNTRQTARGAILVFLLVQLTHGATDGKIGTSNPFSEYVKYLPIRFPIPTFWNEAERSVLTGTSLSAALNAKLRSLDREFRTLREATSSLDWCNQFWWDTNTGQMTFDDWKQVDAMYRSRALDLPGTGHATIPIIDMANHASGNETNARYETDKNGDAVLLLQGNKKLAEGEEITITYGDEKGACEMLFSYGFIEPTFVSARELFLDLDIPDDDPLKIAKKEISTSAPGFRLYEKAGSVEWEGHFVWLLCINEEDGLEFKILQNTNGERELQACWNDQGIADTSMIRSFLEQSPLWEILHLRAVVLLQTRVEQQLFKLASSRKYFKAAVDTRTSTGGDILRLRDLEENLMLHAYEVFENMASAEYYTGCSH